MDPEQIAIIERRIEKTRALVHKLNHLLTNPRPDLSGWKTEADYCIDEINLTWDGNRD